MSSSCDRPSNHSGIRRLKSRNGTNASQASNADGEETILPKASDHESIPSLPSSRPESVTAIALGAPLSSPRGVEPTTPTAEEDDQSIAVAHLRPLPSPSFEQALSQTQQGQTDPLGSKGTSIPLTTSKLSCSPFSDSQPLRRLLDSLQLANQVSEQLQARPSTAPSAIQQPALKASHNLPLRASVPPPHPPPPSSTPQTIVVENAKSTKGRQLRVTSASPHKVAQRNRKRRSVDPPAPDPLRRVSSRLANWKTH